MADIMKVKPKKNYEWNQDPKYIHVQIPLPNHLSLKKVEIYLSDLILRVTSLEKKSTQLLDLFDEVDYKSSQNKFIFSDGHLHATLKKVKPQNQWPSLIIEDISLAELKQRRRESQQRYEQVIKQKNQLKNNLRVEYDQKGTKQIMRLEQVQRDKLDSIKKVQKQQAINEVYYNINEESGKIDKNKKLEREEDKWKLKSKLALEMLDKEEEQERNFERQMKKNKNREKMVQEVKKKVETKNNTMFTEQQINKYEALRQKILLDAPEQLEYEQIPIRKAATQVVKFTQKIHPHLAAREQFYNEPPMPKSRNAKGQLTDDVDTKNPLWLKDKGDKFYHDKNYAAAFDAYSQVIKIDDKFIKAYLNRTLCLMKMFRIGQALADCERCLMIMQSQISGQQKSSESQQTFLKVKLRKAMCLAYKGELAQSKKQMQELLSSCQNQQIKIQITNCIESITKRQESIALKVKGDELVKLNKYESAAEYYDESISKDENQYSVSNKMLCLHKLEKYEGAAELADNAIKKMTSFTLTNPIGKESSQLLALIQKIYYKKAKFLQSQNKFTEANQSLHKSLALNPDADTQQLLKQISKKQSKEKLKELKNQSINLIKEAKYKQALEVYAKCLKLLEANEDIQEYLGILQNQCVCYLKMEEFDSIVSCCIRILKIVANLEAKVLEFGGKRASNLTKEELDKISVRTLMRRANAYARTGQVYNAKADLEKAVQIDPNDKNVKKELQKVKQQLGL